MVTDGGWGGGGHTYWHTSSWFDHSCTGLGHFDCLKVVWVQSGHSGYIPSKCLNPLHGWSFQDYGTPIESSVKQNSKYLSHSPIGEHVKHAETRINKKPTFGGTWLCLFSLVSPVSSAQCSRCQLECSGGQNFPCISGSCYRSILSDIRVWKSQKNNISHGRGAFSLDVLPSWADRGSCAHKSAC